LRKLASNSNDDFEAAYGKFCSMLIRLKELDAQDSVKIFVLGALSFGLATACGLLFAKFMNLFLKKKINPLLGTAVVSAVPDSARVVHVVGQREDPSNFLLMHAMAPNVSGVIGSAIAAGVLWSLMI